MKCSPLVLLALLGMAGCSEPVPIIHSPTGAELGADLMNDCPMGRGAPGFMDCADKWSDKRDRLLRLRLGANVGYLGIDNMEHAWAVGDYNKAVSRLPLRYQLGPQF